MDDKPGDASRSGPTVEASLEPQTPSSLRTRLVFVQQRPTSNPIDGVPAPGLLTTAHRTSTGPPTLDCRQLQSMDCNQSDADEPSPKKAKLVSSEDTDSPMTVQASGRRVVEEICSTEHKFIKTLETVLHHFKRGVVNRRMLSDAVVSVIFPSTLERLVDIHQDLYSKLCLESDAVAVARLVSSFIEAEQTLAAYSEYANHFKTSLRVLNEAQSRSEPLTDLLTELKASPVAGNLDLSAHLLTPIQRLPRYLLLLRSLAKHAPQLAEQVETSSERVESLISRLNASVDAFKASHVKTKSKRLTWGKTRPRRPSSLIISGPGESGSGGETSEDMAGTILPEPSASGPRVSLNQSMVLVPSWLRRGSVGRSMTVRRKSLASSREIFETVRSSAKGPCSPRNASSNRIMELSHCQSEDDVSSVSSSTDRLSHKENCETECSLPAQATSAWPSAAAVGDEDHTPVNGTLAVSPGATPRPQCRSARRCEEDKSGLVEHNEDSIHPPTATLPNCVDETRPVQAHDNEHVSRKRFRLARRQQRKPSAGSLSRHTSSESLQSIASITSITSTDSTSARSKFSAGLQRLRRGSVLRRNRPKKPTVNKLDIGLPQNFRHVAGAPQPQLIDLNQMSDTADV